MMSLAACVSRCPSTTRWPWLANVALAQERLQHRRFGLLELQEERVVAVAAEQQHDEGAGADAADTDDLASRMDVAVALQQLAPVARQRPAVGADRASEEVLELVRALAQARSSIGTTTGGSLMMRGSPSTISVSFANAFRLSFERVLAMPAS